jgi:hypothetical protein
MAHNVSIPLHKRESAYRLMEEGFGGKTCGIKKAGEGVPFYFLSLRNEFILITEIIISYFDISKYIAVAIYLC